MCGIAGWVDWQRDLTQERGVVEAMGKELACRGPDAAGSYCERQVAFAHRRLIVVDPAGGGQPMVREMGEHQYVVNYNGELYNTAELRDELAARGHHCNTRSDTEVLLRAYMAWGPDCVTRLNGIFAFAIWDWREHEIFLARDRLGVKPLFYTRQGDGLLFASEVKALLRHPLVEPVIDREGLAELFAVGPARTPGHGVFRGVQELRPGCWLRYGRDGSELRQYWRLESHEHEDDLEATAERVRALLQDAVERQLVSDVPVCALLSGGLDSSAVSALAAAGMRKQKRGALRTFSVDFVDQERFFRPNGFQTNLDAPWVQRMSEYLGTEHRRVLLDTPELSAHLMEALHARDFPGMADVDTSLMLFCREIKREATVALSGEAADELFGGYPWCHRPDAIAAQTFPWARRLDDRVRILSPELIAEIRPHDYVEMRYREALDEVPRLAGEDPHEDRLREIIYLNLTRFLANLLDRKDRMSMASGLEVRVPFCDHRLVEYVWNIPWAMKSHGGVAKGILRQALAGLLPDEVRERRKSPYPSTMNPSYFGAMRALMQEVVSDQTSPILPLIELGEIRRLLAIEGEPPEIPWFGQLLGLAGLFAYLVQANNWLRQYKVRIA